jgi:hypothetical protein
VPFLPGIEELRPLARLRTPEGLELLQVARDRIWAVARDELDVPRCRARVLWSRRRRYVTNRLNSDIMRNFLVTYMSPLALVSILAGCAPVEDGSARGEDATRATPTFDLLLSLPEAGSEELVFHRLIGVGVTPDGSGVVVLDRIGPPIRVFDASGVLRSLSRDEPRNPGRPSLLADHVRPSRMRLR